MASSYESVVDPQLLFDMDFAAICVSWLKQIVVSSSERIELLMFNQAIPGALKGHDL